MEIFGGKKWECYNNKNKDNKVSAKTQTLDYSGRGESPTKE